MSLAEMKTTRLVLSCDKGKDTDKQCKTTAAFVDFLEESAAKALTAAREQGWYVNKDAGPDGRVLCPEHHPRTGCDDTLRQTQSTENRDQRRLSPFQVCLLLTGLVCGIAGCQPVPPPLKAPAANHSESGTKETLMELWQVYTHCQTSEDPEGLVIDAMRLNQAAVTTPPKPFPMMLEPIEEIVEPPPVRLAVDPNAMAAACSIRAAHAAMERGWYDLAITLYRSIIPAPPDAQSTYYVERAQVGLAEAINRKALLVPKKPPLSSLASPKFVRP